MSPFTSLFDRHISSTSVTVSSPVLASRDGPYCDGFACYALPVPVIFAIVAGSLAVLAFLFTLLCCLRCRRRRKREKKEGVQLDAELAEIQRQYWSGDGSVAPPGGGQFETGQGVVYTVRESQGMMKPEEGTPAPPPTQFHQGGGYQLAPHEALGSQPPIPPPSYQHGPVYYPVE